MPTTQRGRMETQDLLLIGRRERVSFPEWGLERIRAKIDTGAYSAALHVQKYEWIGDEAGKMVRLHINPSRRQPERVLVVEVPVVGTVSVRCSNGKHERRPLIEPLVRVGPVTRRIRLTVTDRSRMRCPMLLGRQALAGHFLVDVRCKDLL